MTFRRDDRVRVISAAHFGEVGVVAEVGSFRPKGVSKTWNYGVVLDGRKEPIGFNQNELAWEVTQPETPAREMVNHPAHYGGGDNPFEVYKVLEAWGLTRFAYLWNCIKYIARAEKKNNALEDLRKARWYLDREIAVREAAQREKA